MTRRSERTTYAILGVLHEHGPRSARDLSRLLHHRLGNLYNTLSDLEATGSIVGEREEREDDQPRLRVYRISTENERRDWQQARRRVEQAIAERTAERTALRRKKK